MKRLFLFFGISAIVASCHTPKAVVTNNNYPPRIPQTISQITTTPPPSRNPVNNNNKNNNPVPVVKDSAITTTANTTASTPIPAVTPTHPVYDKPITIVDNRGRIVITKEQLPDSVSTDLSALSSIRAFTPDQAKNLASRYNFIPPKVIYVPSALAKKGRKGMYYIYNQKFWYWKKEDGFFYLDANYYN
jgi:hypothetical protein